MGAISTISPAFSPASYRAYVFSWPFPCPNYGHGDAECRKCRGLRSASILQEDHDHGMELKLYKPCGDSTWIGMWRACLRMQFCDSIMKDALMCLLQAAWLSCNSTSNAFSKHSAFARPAKELSSLCNRHDSSKDSIKICGAVIRQIEDSFCVPSC